MIIRRLALCALCALVAFVARCSHPSSVAMTGGSEVVGRMVDQHGRPVKGATVFLDTSASSSDTTYQLLSSATTDAGGAFAVTINHGGGVYSIYGDYDNEELVVLIQNIHDSVASDASHRVNVGTDTMLPPGFISGTVTVDEASMTGTICYIPGTSLIAITDDNGNFVMSGIPVGSYQVYFSHPDYLVGKAGPVAVVSKDTAGIGTIVLSYDPSKPVPTPRSVGASYDTVHGVATIAWHAVHVPDLKGYVVYRGIDGSAIAGIDTVPASDTAVFDTLYRSFSDTSRHTCQYEVAAFDSAPNFGNKSNPVTVSAVPPSLVRTILAFHVVGSASSGDTVQSGDTAALEVTFANAKNNIRLLAWYAAFPDSMIRQDSFDVQHGSDTLWKAFPASGHAILYVNATDERGGSWLDSVSLIVLPRHIDAVSADSMTAGITITWTMSRLPNFAAYRLYRLRASGQSLLYETTSRSDTSHTISFTTNGVFQYGIVEIDKSGTASPFGATVRAAIKNTPPVFIEDTSAIPTTALVGKPYSLGLIVTDVNGDSIVLKQLAGPGLTLLKDSLHWTPGIADTGTRRISIQASDGFGGYDTLAWNVQVMPVGVCAAGDSMSVARFSLSAAIVNGVLYAAGGAKFFNSGGRLVPIPLSTVEAYPLSGATFWTKAASLASPRYALGCAGAGNDLYAFGGTKDGVNHFATVDSISTSGSVWDTACTLPAPLAGCAVCTFGTKVYCFGGLEKISGTDVVSDHIYEFDPSTGQCVLKNYMLTRRVFHQVVVMNGKIYIIGGLGGATSQYDCVPQGSVEAYDPATNMMDPDTLGQLNAPRYYFGAAEANGKLYAIGGCPSASSDSSLSSIEEFDPARNQWTFKTDLPSPRSNCAAASWQGKVYVVGGIVAGNAVKSVVVYYP